MADAFARDSVIRRVNSEPAILFGAGRALILQLAHPHVAAGVAQHSDFQHNPFKRLQGTLEAVYTMVHGSAELADGVGRRVRWIHEFVTSPTYRANDPENLLWVHATLLDSALGCYQRLVEPLSPADVETYYKEMTAVAERFGCPRSAQPRDYAAFQAYWDEQVGSIVVTDDGRRLAADVLSPRRMPRNLHLPLKPALAIQRLVAIGTTPEPLRAQFGWGWDEGKQRRLERLHSLTLNVNSRVPRAVRVAPVHLHGRYLLHQARKHVAAHDARAAASPGASVAV
ncbi:MAG: oxygenase MpaB family protein [Acidimicrobiales bacterium]